MTQVIRSVETTRETARRLRANSRSIGFVPTMGALHEGHLELIRSAKRDNDVVLASIFVNPTQFNSTNDLEKYPRTFERDLALLESVGADYLFYPEYKDIYRDNYRYKVIETEFSRFFCGAHRPGHFDGVLTVVLKLLNIISADRAYFGEKDFQQLQLISQMVDAFFIDVKIVPVPIVREKDGLAMSSRNMRLTTEQRQIAPAFFEVLKGAASDFSARERLEQLGFRVDYIETHEHRRLGAVYLGDVRLIDNVQI